MELILEIGCEGDVAPGDEFRLHLDQRPFG